MNMSSDKVYRRYLSLLGWVGDPGLHGLVRSHLIKVPFENISGLLAVAAGDAPAVPSIETFLKGIRERSLGGAYFAPNLHFASLLRFLDYEVELLSTRFGNTDHAHPILRVTHEGVRYVVDVAYGAPLYEPLALDRDEPHRISHGQYEFELSRHPVVKGTYELATLQSGKKIRAYSFKDEPVDVEVFEPAVEALFSKDSEFLQDLRITRFFDSRVLEVHGRNVITTNHNVTTTEPALTVEDLENTVQELMLLDRCPVREALDVLREHMGVTIVAR